MSEHQCEDCSAPGTWRDFASAQGEDKPDPCYLCDYCYGEWARDKNVLATPTKPRLKRVPENESPFLRLVERGAKP